MVTNTVDEKTNRMMESISLEMWKEKREKKEINKKSPKAKLYFFNIQ